MKTSSLVLVVGRTRLATFKLSIHGFRRRSREVFTVVAQASIFWFKICAELTCASLRSIVSLNTRVT